MKTLALIPSPVISQYVSSIMVLENDHAYAEAVLPLIATGYPSIVFQLTDTGLLFSKKSDNLVLYGQNIKPIHLHTARHVTVIAYFLYPHTLRTLFGIHAKELTDAGIDLNLTDPARGMSLKEQLLNAPSLQQRLQLLDGYVQKLATRAKVELNDGISFATRSILQSRGMLSITQVQKELYITERTLQRMFELHVGVSPKTFSRICQFRSAFQQLSNNQFSDMISVAYDNGYADQSHLIRAFKEFTNYTPLEYLKQAVDFPG